MNKPKSKQEALDMIKQLEEFVKDEDNKGKKRWEPKRGDKYWCVDKDDSVRSYNWVSNYVDVFYYEIGNVFMAEEEAAHELKRGFWAKRRAEMRIRDYMLEHGMEFEPDWKDPDEDKFYLYYGYSTGGLGVGIQWEYVISSQIWFKSREDAEQCAKNCKEDWKILFGINS